MYTRLFSTYLFITSLLFAPVSFSSSPSLSTVFICLFASLLVLMPPPLPLLTWNLDNIQEKHEDKEIKRPKNYVIPFKVETLTRLWLCMHMRWVNVVEEEIKCLFIDLKCCRWLLLVVGSVTFFFCFFECLLCSFPAFDRFGCLNKTTIPHF